MFTRPTFLAFTLPIIAQAFVWTLFRAAEATSGQPRSAFVKTWARIIALPLALASVYLSCITFVDTLFFRQNLYGVVLTPLNFLKYNLSSSNLAEHGVHPRWLHLIVNLPLIVGPGLVYYGIRATHELWKRPATSLLEEKGTGKRGPQTRPLVFTSMPKSPANERTLTVSLQCRYMSSCLVLVFFRSSVIKSHVSSSHCWFHSSRLSHMGSSSNTSENCSG